MKLLLLTLLLLVITPYYSHGGGSRILILTPMGSKSHKIFFMGFAEPLAKRGHQITMVSLHEESKKIDNFRDVIIQNLTLHSVLSNVFEKNSNVSKSMFEKLPQECVDGLGQKQIQDLKKEKFDIILISMFFDFCYLSFVHHFKVPFIYVSPAGLFGPFNDMIGNLGNPEFPSITGNKLVSMDFPLSFKDRLSTTGISLYFSYASKFNINPRMLKLCKDKGLCPPDMPSFDEFDKNASLAILNSVRTLEHPPRPAMPNIIYAGGAHIQPPKPLPKDLEEWVQGSGEDGFIFFSLGSALNPSFLPESYRKILVNVFGSLKQRVLWKWAEDTMPDLPKNVKLGKWLPQSDILGHPKLRLFITHGGLLSTLESTYNGVPLIGMPIIADQFINMGEVEKEGWGKTMLWEALEENAFRKLIQEVLSNKKMREISQHRSAVMKDMLVHPGDEAAYWVEYVLRHKGAPHILSPFRKMCWVEIYNVDVWAFIITVLLGILYFVYFTLKFILRKCCGASKSQKSKNKRD